MKLYFNTLSKGLGIWVCLSCMWWRNKRSIQGNIQLFLTLTSDGEKLSLLIPANLGELVGPGAVVCVVGNGKYLPALMNSDGTVAWIRYLKPYNSLFGCYRYVQNIFCTVPSRSKCINFVSLCLESGAWLVDFYTPWCPPCLRLLPELRKASRHFDSAVNFGTVDCTIHAALCRQHNIRSYPTTILYNNTEKQQFLGDHTATSVVDFLQDFLNPIGLSYPKC